MAWRIKNNRSSSTCTKVSLVIIITLGIFFPKELFYCIIIIINNIASESVSHADHLI